MGSEFTFYDYVENGKNLIHEWLNGPAKDVRTKLNNRIRHLEATNKGSWTRPMVDTLTGDCDGLFEIRMKRGRVQYRILGFHGPNANAKQVTLLYCFIKRDGPVPTTDCDEARRRIAKIANQQKGGVVVVHDFSQPSATTTLGQSK